MGLFSCILLSVSISRCQLPENVQLDKKNSSGDNMFSVNVALKWGDAENTDAVLNTTSSCMALRPGLCTDQQKKSKLKRRKRNCKAFE